MHINYNGSTFTATFYCFIANTFRQFLRKLRFCLLKHGTETAFYSQMFYFCDIWISLQVLDGNSNRPIHLSESLWTPQKHKNASFYVHQSMVCIGVFVCGMFLAVSCLFVLAFSFVLLRLVISITTNLIYMNSVLMSNVTHRLNILYTLRRKFACDS